jgi:hypothetical protein
MNLELLFLIKEKMLRELTESLETKHFSSEAAKQTYYEISMESIMRFYTELQDKIDQEAA